MSDFPSTKKTFSQLVDGTTIMEGTNVNQAYDEVEAIQTFIGAMGRAQSYSTSLKGLLTNYRYGCKTDIKSVADFYVRAGEIYIPDASGNGALRRNTTDTTVTWANIDTGSEAASTWYYVYARADTAATTFTVIFSTSDSAPSGGTYYRKIGAFYNDASSNITITIDYADDAFPKGGIIMWAGTIANIPTGWALCDGSNGTPDLTDRFVIHADADGGGTRNVGDSGGAHTKDLSHTHTGWTLGVSFTTSDGSTSAGTLDTKHRHSFTTDTGGSATQDIMPKYYALAYIMKKY